MSEASLRNSRACKRVSPTKGGGARAAVAVAMGVCRVDSVGDESDVAVVRRQKHHNQNKRSEVMR